MKSRYIKSAISLAVALVMVISMSFMNVESVAAPTLDEINRLKAEAAEISAEKEGIAEKIENAENEKYSLLVKKSAMDDQVQLTVEEIYNITEQIELYEKLITEKEAELEKAQEKEDKQLALYKERVRVMEEAGSISYLAVIFDAATFSDLLARLDFVFEVMHYDEKLYHDYIEAKEETKLAKEALEVTKDGLEETRDSLEDKKEELEKRRTDATNYIAELQSTIEGFTALFAQADAAEAEVWAEVNRLLAEYEAEKNKQDQEKEDNKPESDTEEPEEEEEETPEEPEEEEEENETPSVSGQFIWPAPASLIVTSRYGNRIHPIYGIERFHYGIDIGAYRGSSIVAADGGTIITAYEHSSYGNFCMIDHGNGFVTLYAHMDTLYASAGDVVQQGEVLGLCGDTGTANGPHLHFEVQYNGVYQDPLDYLSGYGYQIWE